MTLTDWSPLSGDPGCLETLDEWADGMLAQLDKMSPRQCTQTISEMTEEERDMIRERVATFEVAMR